MPLIELVHHGDEAAGCIVSACAHGLHVGQQHCVKLPGQLYVVPLGSRGAAELLELHIQYPFPHSQRAKLTMVDLQGRSRDLPKSGQLPEIAVQIGLGLLIQREVIDFRLLQGAQPVINATIHIKHLAVALDQFDGRQETGPLQAVAIEILGWNVGGGHQHHTMTEQLLEQGTQQHGIRDVGDEKLVKADDVCLAGELAGDELERIGLTGQPLEFIVHPMHETVEVDAQFALPRQAVEKSIHQPGLASAHSAPHIETQDGLAGFRLLQPAQQATGSGRSRAGAQILIESLQAGHCHRLGRVGQKAGTLQILLVFLLRGHPVNRLQVPE